jgi:hypothetical protein
MLCEHYDWPAAILLAYRLGLPSDLHQGVPERYFGWNT